MFKIHIGFPFFMTLSDYYNEQVGLDQKPFCDTYCNPFHGFFRLLFLLNDISYTLHNLHHEHNASPFPFRSSTLGVRHQIRDIQKQLKEKGMSMLTEADESSEGPAHFIVEDPDGNQILFDQHR
ncbi:hypothetical protein ACIQXV_11800 [Neobacillus sp. NPDC097160]|uniref:hypothetical protein n=1 Tax=Neobacillus sp. NPDC097160 TaxID=3364298 RepID=UPI00380EB008